jgi:spore maturation protein CgeB
LCSSYKAINNSLFYAKTKEQIKGRNFEICGCSGFQLTYYAEELEQHFEINKEVRIYMDVDDLIEKIRYYLRQDEEREAITEAGYQKALSKHTYAQRFTEIVNHIFGD